MKEVEITHIKNNRVMIRFLEDGEEVEHLKIDIDYLEPLLIAIEDHLENVEEFEHINTPPRICAYCNKPIEGSWSESTLGDICESCEYGGAL